MGPFERLVERLSRACVRFVVIGLSGANYYAGSGRALFLTQDRDLFLPPDPDLILATWRACEDLGLDLVCGDEPLDRPRDRLLAEGVLAHKALVRATDGIGLDVDFPLVMAGFDFETVWNDRRIFRVGRVEIPVARLSQIIESKRRVGRDKDRLFFATHAETIRELVALERKSGPTDRPTAPRQGKRGGSSKQSPRRRR